MASNENAIVSFRMEVAPPDRPHGGLKIQSTVPNAEVFLDGSSLGRAPVDRSDLDPGKHYVSVHRDGYTDFKREIMLVENQPVALVADLSATGSLRILSTPEGAEVRIDGELIGRTPVAHDAAAGDHVVEFRLKGYFDHKETMKAEGGREKIFSVDLKRHPDRPDARAGGAPPDPDVVVRREGQPGRRRHRRLRPRLSLVHDLRRHGRRLRAEEPGKLRYRRSRPGRSSSRRSSTSPSAALRGRLQIVSVGPLAVGAEGDFGGGSGVNGRSSFFGDASVIASLAFADVATVSAYGKLSLWDDAFCPPQSQLANGVSADAYCGYPPALDAVDKMALFGAGDPRRGFSGHRLYVGFSASAAIDRLTSLFFQFEFVPATQNYGLTPRMEFEESTTRP